MKETDAPTHTTRRIKEIPKAAKVKAKMVRVGVQVALRKQMPRLRAKEKGKTNPDLPLLIEQLSMTPQSRPAEGLHLQEERSPNPAATS